MIAIIKYKAGNLASVSNALDRLGAPYFFASSPDELESATGIIFPGVGHIDAALQSLEELNIANWLKKTTKPVLGICVGMQLFYEGSEEGDGKGLGIIPGTLRKFDETKAKVPHMGWNTFSHTGEHTILKNISEKDYMYYVHSFYAPVNEYTMASCNYINEFSSVVTKDNFIGIQFHAEKSGNAGSHILQNFLDLVHEKERKKKVKIAAE